MELKYLHDKPRSNMASGFNEVKQTLNKIKTYSLSRRNTPSFLQAKLEVKPTVYPLRQSFMDSSLVVHPGQSALQTTTEESIPKGNSRPKYPLHQKPIRLYTEGDRKSYKRHLQTELTTAAHNLRMDKEYLRYLEACEEEENSMLHTILGTPMRKHSENLTRLTNSPTNSEYASQPIKKRSVSVSKKTGINPAVLYFSNKGASEIKKPLQLSEGPVFRHGSRSGTPSLLAKPTLDTIFHIQKIQPQGLQPKFNLPKSFDWTRKLDSNQKQQVVDSIQQTQEHSLWIRPLSRDGSKLEAFAIDTNAEKYSLILEKSMLGLEEKEFNISTIKKTKVSRLRKVRKKASEGKGARSYSPNKFYKHNGKTMLLPGTTTSS